MISVITAAILAILWSIQTGIHDHVQGRFVAMSATLARLLHRLAGNSRPLADERQLREAIATAEGQTRTS
ncbi:MAG: hypothetical protein JO152_02285 [Mycobacteriaceae bacterium]|nr:hypothetical protein [Mycobacteriaceae bacterium]